MSGRSHRFLDITSTFWDGNVSCSRIQHGDLSVDRTPTSRSGVRRSTTKPRCLLKLYKCVGFKHKHMFVCFVQRGWLVGNLILYVPVNNFSVMSGRSHRFLGITSTFWGVNVPCSRTQHGLTRVGLEPPTSDPESELLTTRPPRSPVQRGRL